MNRFLKIVYTSMLFITLSMAPEASANTHEEQRVIITFEDDVNEQAIEAASGDINFEFDSLPVVSVTISESGLKKLKNDPTIKKIEKDVIVRTNTQVLDWGIPKMNFPLAWQTGYTGRGIKVAVVDSGISSHEDLVIAGGVSFVDYTTSYQDDNGHGTHVAGIIRASDNGFGIKGVASEVDLYAVKSIDQNGSAYLSSIIAGIDWAISNEMDIINLSLSTQSDSISFQNILDKAYEQGILVVAAAGNDGTGSGDTVDFPARYASVIGVGAIDQQNQLASFSSTGPNVEIVAPGVSVLSTYLNGSYARLNGTSMATPFVSGYFALLKQAYPSLSNKQLRSILITNTQDLGSPGFDTLYGNGLLKANSFSLPLFATPASGNPAININLSKKDVKLFPGESEKVTAIVELKDGTQLDITKEAVWSSTDMTLATVDTGSVRANKVGNAIISASYGGLKSSMNIEIVDSNQLKSLQLNVSSIQGQIGEKKAIILTAIRNDGSSKNVTKEVQWISSDTSVSDITDGSVMFKKAGKTTIKATLENKTVTINVEVLATKSAEIKDFKDVPSSFWAYKDINTLRDRKIILGYEDNTFKPNATIRRDHVALLLSKSITFENMTVAKDFVDVPRNYVYYDQIMQAQMAGIFSGNQGRFDPKEELTRAQMAKVLVLAFDLKKKGDHPFSDVSKNHWSSDYISILYSNGISIGDNGKYSPEAPVTRAHFAAFMSRSFALTGE